MPSIDEIIRRITIEAETQGVDRATGELNQLAKAQGGVATASETTAKSMVSVERALDSASRRYDTAYRQQQDVEKLERTLSAARQQGLVSAEREAELLELQAVQFGKVRAAAELSATGLHSVDAQMERLVAAVASGHNPFEAMAHSGLKLSEVLGEGRGVTGAIRLVGASFAEFMLNPITLGAIGFFAIADAATEFAKSVLDPGAEIDAMMKRQADELARIKDGYSEAGKAAREFHLVSDAQEMRTALESVADAQEKVRSEAEGLAGALSLRGNEFGLSGAAGAAAMRQEYGKLLPAVEAFIQSVKDGRPDILAFNDAVNKEALAEPGNAALQDMADELSKAAENGVKAATGLQKFEAQAHVLQGTATEAEKALLGLRTELERINLHALLPARQAQSESMDDLRQQEIARGMGAARAALRDDLGAIAAAEKEASRIADEHRKRIESVRDALAFQAAQLGRTAEEQEVYNNLQAAGVDISSRIGKEIAEETRRVYELTKAHEEQQKAVEAVQRAQEEAQQFLGQSLFDAVKGADDATDAMKKFALALAEAAAQALLLGQGPLAGLFGTTSQSGGLLGSLFAGFTPTHHDGHGPGDPLLTGRFLHPAYFDDAPRYHSGIGPGEHAAIIRDDESVLTPGQMRALGQDRGAVTIPVAVNISGGAGGMSNEDIAQTVKKTVKNALDNYDRALPGRVARINRHPRDRQA